MRSFKLFLLGVVFLPFCFLAIVASAPILLMDDDAYTPIDALDRLMGWLAGRKP